MKTPIFVRKLAWNFILVLTSVSPSIYPQSSDGPDRMRFVPNVVDQFVALTFQLADPLGFHKEGTPDPSTCRHYQGMARVDGADGTPFFLVTRSGNVPDDTPACPTGDGPIGNLVVFRMGSRPKTGERMRSNRLRKGVHVDDTEPPAEDRATAFFSFVDGGLVPGNGGPGLPARAYQHPGGMQLVGNILAVAVESPLRLPTSEYPVAPNPTLIMFFDVSNPEAPVFKSQFAPVHPEDGEPFEKAGVVAITPLPNGLYLLATTGGDGSEVHFFRSTIGDLSSADLSWEFVDKVAPEVDDDPQQTLQFIREGDIHGDLYLAGVRGHPIFGADHDKVDLYLVHGQTENFELDEEITMGIRRRGRVIRTFPNSGGERLANGAAASTFHVSPSGELILYVTEHDNDGPGGTVKAGEWTHIDMVRYGSPTYLPTANVGGPYEVDEGGTIALNGSAGPPITKAWIQLYNAHDFGSVDFLELNIMVDFDDRDLDDFDNFFLFEHVDNSTFTFGNTPSSWRWFAPPGCSIRARDFGDGTSDDQPEAKTLVGDGAVHGEDSDLGLVLNDDGNSSIDNEIDAVEFLDGCDAYYSAPVFLEWDLDVNGSFETTGNAITFSALEYDGPAEVNVPAQARHSTSGQVGLATARISVRNVAPEFTQFGLIDSGGNQIGTAVPFVVTGSPVTVGAGFVDPGVLDHQTASIDWGDGISQGNAAFTAFDEAFGDGTGALAHSHRYSASGNFSITTQVSDDDGGSDIEQRSVRVLTPEQALVEMIAMLDAAITACPNSAVCFDLGRARVALAGSRPESVNGALNMIRAGDRPSAVAFLNTAGTWLERAEADGGSGLDALQALVTQVASALSH